MVENQKHNFNRVHFSSTTYRRNTPPALFKELHKEFKFNFDPAVPPIIGDYDENALTKRWKLKKNIKKKLRAYINPPYDRKLMERFIKKAYQELREGRMEIAVFLLPLRSTAIRFLVKLDEETEFRVLEDRLIFGHPCCNDDCNITIFEETPYWLDKKNKLQYCSEKCAATTDEKKVLEEKLLGAPFDSVIAILRA